MIRTLGDQEISPDLYKDALVLSHLARSVLAASCNAVARHTGQPPLQRTPAGCAADPKFMTEFGDRDTLETMARLYQRVAASIGEPEEAVRRLDLLVPATAAGYAFDLVGMIDGIAPALALVGPRETNPLMVQYLAAGPRAPETKKSIAAPVAIAVAALAIGVGAGYMLTRQR